MHRLAHFSLIALGLLISNSSGSDFEAERESNWHHWRGPSASGVAPQADPPLRWDENTNIAWKVRLPGKGSSTPIVWNDRVFVTTAIATDRRAENAPDAADQPAPRSGRRGRFGGGAPPTNYHQFALICLDRRTGEMIWQRIANEEVPHEGLHQTNTYASGSPTTDGEYVYASFGSRGIFCYDFAGQLRWQRDLGDMQTRNGFGEGSSPTLHGDTLVVPWDHEGPSFVAALDARTGEVRWRVERDERSTWATPFVIEHKGQTQVILNGSNRVRSYDLADGRLIWECGGQASNPIPSPLSGNGLVFCMTGYRGFAVYAIPLDATGDISDSQKIAWNRTDAGPYVSSPLLYKDRIYHTKDRNAILSCLDTQTGQPVYHEKRLPGLRSIYASPVAAKDRIYITGREGTTLVIQHGPQLEVLASNTLDEGIDASPALVGNQILLRGESHLYCIAESGGQ